jgi:nickel transport system substrate-binding protein
MFSAVSFAALVTFISADTLVVTPTTQTGFFKLGHDIGAMNPHAYRPNEFVTNDWVFEGLTSWDSTSAGVDGITGTADYFVVPALAKSWTTNYEEIKNDPSMEYVITFNIRPNVAFHDGMMWDSVAAKLNFDHILGGSSKSFAGFHDWYGLAAAIKSWEAVDGSTFKIIFNSYYEPALRELSFIRPFRMISPAALPDLNKGELSCAAWKNGGPRVTPDGKYTCRGVAAPIGTGPYKVVGKKLAQSNGKPGERFLPAAAFNASCYENNMCTYKLNEQVFEVHFQKFSQHRSNPAYETVIARAYRNQHAIRDALLDGSLDVAYGVNVLYPTAFVGLGTEKGSAVMVHKDDKNLNTRTIVFNSAGTLNTSSLRKMVVAIIDRDSLYQAELGEEEPMETLFDPKLPYCNISLGSIADLASTTKSTASDIKYPLRFAYLKEVPHQNIIAARIMANLYENGIQVQPLPMAKDEYNKAMNSWLGPNGDGVGGTITFDIAYSETWGPSYDPTTKLFDMTYEWGSGEADAVATSNLPSLPKDLLVKKINQLSSTIDNNARQKLYTEVLTSLHKEAVFLPLSAKRNVAVVNKRVFGFQFGSTQFDFPIETLYPAVKDTQDACSELVDAYPKGCQGKNWVQYCSNPKYLKWMEGHCAKLCCHAATL